MNSHGDYRLLIAHLILGSRIKEKVIEQLKRLSHWKMKDGKVKCKYDHLVVLKAPINEVHGVDDEWGRLRCGVDGAGREHQEGERKRGQIDGIRKLELQYKITEQENSRARRNWWKTKADSDKAECTRRRNGCRKIVTEEKIKHGRILK